MTTLVIKTARPQDAQILSFIDNSYKTSANWTTDAMLAELKNENSVILKACLDNEVTGFAAGKIIPPELQILNIAVKPENLRYKMASNLISALIEKSKKQYCIKATLEVNCNNIPALNLYRSMGFKIVGRRPKFYNNEHTAILMDLEYV